MDTWFTNPRSLALWREKLYEVYKDKSYFYNNLDYFFSEIGEEMHNPVTKPSHYQFSKPCNEVRDVIRDRLKGLLDEDAPATEYDVQELIYDYSNAIKYLLRWYAKNPLEDLKKARYCIDTMIELLEKDE